MTTETVNRITVDAAPEKVLGGKEWIPGISLLVDSDGTTVLRAQEWHSSEAGSCLMSVWHSRDLEYTHTLSQGSLAVADPEKLKALAERLTPLVERLRAGHSIKWDGSNMVGKLDADAVEAHALLDDAFCDPDWQSDEWEAWAAAEWLREPPDGLTHETTDKKLAEMAEGFERDARTDGVLIEGSLVEALEYWRDRMRHEAEL